MNYTATHFPASYGAPLSGSHALDFGWPELLWAAITVGRAELLHVLRHGPFSAFEIVYRAAILYANLRETGSGELARSAAYDGLDPSEKGAISYFMGLTAAKMFAHRLLDVPWLMHLDVYREELQPVHGAAKPDLVGKNAAGDWIAIESKGRTHGLDERAMLRAKEQVESLVSVDGQPVALRVALLAHFDGDVLQSAVDDPDEPPRKGRPRTNLPLTEKLLFEGYYRPFREWLDSVCDQRSVRSRGRRS